VKNEQSYELLVSYIKEVENEADRNNGVKIIFRIAYYK
jgi:hypothetical protein